MTKRNALPTDGTFSGSAELWLDPLGNDVKISECTITVANGAVSYTWTYEGKPHSGSVTPSDAGASFTDTWHNPEPMACTHVVESWAPLDVAGTYAAGDGPDWGWRITVSARPTGEIVLQMVNITPWGKHGRAVRMVGKPT